MKRTRHTSAWRLIVVVALVLPLLLSLGGIAAAQDAAPMEEERVLLQPPARDAAFVADLAGFKSVVAESFVRKLGLSEGLVIRKSYIEDGQIIIPPSGLYYTTRTPLSKAMQGDKMLILGDLYHFVDYSTRMDVVSDVDMILGDCAPIGDGSKCWELSSITFYFAGDIPQATFKILKPSGNYYGTSFPVVTSDLVVPATVVAEGRGYEEGSFPPGEPDDWHNYYYGYHVATSGQTFLVAEDVTADSAHLVEAATGALNWLRVTAEDPVEASLGEGDTMEVGDYVVRVAAVDTGAQTVEVEILDGDEVVASKTFGPITENFFDYLPGDPLGREQVTLSYEDEVYVHLDLFREPFQEDAASLVAYYDLVRLENPAVWPSDNRFIVRPDI